MKSSIIYIISIIFFSNFVYAGVINKRNVYTDDEDKEVPMRKVIIREKVEDTDNNNFFNTDNMNNNIWDKLLNNNYTNFIWHWFNKDNHSNTDKWANENIWNSTDIPEINPETISEPILNQEYVSDPDPILISDQDSSISISASPISEKFPIKKLTMTTFGKCNQQQSELLSSLVEDVKVYRAAAVYLLENQDEDVMYKKIFEKYFKDTAELSKVKKIFEDINNMSSLEVFCETIEDPACADGAMTWTYLESNEFHVCPIFFTYNTFGSIPEHTSDASSFVIHELTHCLGIEDYAYGEDDISKLSPHTASNNADTYRLFSMSSIYYLNDKKNGINKRDNNSFLSRNIDFSPNPFKDIIIKRSV